MTNGDTQPGQERRTVVFNVDTQPSRLQKTEADLNTRSQGRLAVPNKDPQVNRL